VTDVDEDSPLAWAAAPVMARPAEELEGMGIGILLADSRTAGARGPAHHGGRGTAGTSRAILSLVDHGVSQTRQAAGLGRQRLRMVVPPHLPDALAVETASRLMSAAAAANVKVTWVEAPLDNEFSLIHQRKADAGLGWLPGVGEDLPAPFDVMSLGEFEPVLWIPSWHPAARRGTLTVEELTRMTVVYGPRRAEVGTYDQWPGVLRAADPGFAFTDPPFRHSLPMSVAFAGSASRPTAVLTSPCIAMGSAKAAAREQQLAHACDMVEVSLERHPLVAAAGLGWNTDLPRPLQQILFDTADGLGGAPLARAAPRLPAGRRRFAGPRCSGSRPGPRRAAPRARPSRGRGF
jgi:hypothetical protein